MLSQCGTLKGPDQQWVLYAFILPEHKGERHICRCACKQSAVDMNLEIKLYFAEMRLENNLKKSYVFLK